MKAGAQPARWPAFVVLVAAAAGFFFAAVSTYDFAQHLDRQVHSLNCSFVPGLSSGSDSSGCRTALLSAYSSFWRSSYWGGIPISLPGMAVFAFLAAVAAETLLGGRLASRRATGFVLLVALFPVIASATMGVISATELGAACKLCVGIYIASAVAFAGALFLVVGAARAAQGATPAPAPQKEEEPSSEPAWVSGRPVPDEDPPEPAEPPASAPPVREPSFGHLAMAAAIGVIFVAAPVLGWAAVAPDHRPYVGSCGELETPEDTYGVTVPIGPQAGTAAIELLDPLCPACRAFEARLEQSGLEEKLARRALLFPLDDSCNWMVDEAVHPGACSVSRAVLCAGDRVDEVVEWSFENQKEIMKAEKEAPGAAERMVRERFPELESCIASAEVKSKLNKSLRWAVGNELPVLTPQLFVEGTKLCDEDVDLGLKFALSRLIQQAGRGGGAK